MKTTPRPVLVLIMLAFALALLRAVPLLAHAPLLGIANSFDQARYTGCFDLYPDRPAPIRPDENNPNAPFEFYRFQQNPVPLCYGSSELLQQGVAVGIYKLQQAHGVERYSVRWLGWLRLLLLGALVAAFCLAWLRRGLWPAALANAAVFAAVLSDPSNTLYFHTFYAEPSALFAAYALFNLILLYAQRKPSVRGTLLLSLSALLLAVSKIQHLALPLALAGVVLLLGLWHRRRIAWQGLALLAGAVVGLGLQFAQLSRDDPMMKSIRSFNRANVVFTSLLPVVADPVATTRRLGLPESCAAYAGKVAWQLPGLAEDICPGMEKVSRLHVLREFLREPVSLLRFARNGIAVLNPWLPRNLGHVEGAVLGKLPAGFVSWNGLLDRSPLLRNLLFALPLLFALAALRRPDRLALLAALLATLMLSTFGVAVFGDGLADVAKQGHLIFNAALSWLCVAAVLLATQLLYRRSAYGVDAVDFDQQLGPAYVAQQHQALGRLR